jgi:hypothetical protein
VTGLSLVQRSPTKCVNKITKPTACGGQGRYKDCRTTDDDGFESHPVDRLICLSVVFLSPSVKMPVQLPYVSPEGGVGLVRKRGCLLTLAYYAFPRRYEFGERRWNDIDRGKSKNWEKNLSQCHFVHHKSHMD